MNVRDSRFLANALLLAMARGALAEVHYVDQNSTNATPPYTNWTTAATNIQDAVDAAVAGDEIVVTNGTYASVRVNNPLNVRSVNGPQFTTIDGGGSVRCAYLTNVALLSGFTLTNGFAYYGGGGAYGGTLNNCMLTGNSAPDPEEGAGGGAAYCTLNNCTLSGNSAGAGGGGAYSCTLNNCLLTGNSADFYYQFGQGGGAYGCTLNNCTLTGNRDSGYYGPGGGAASCTLNNCIVYFNPGGNYDASCTLNYCCTASLPNGVGNISADPQMASASHLSAFSPCIGKGNYASVGGVDIDGEAWANPPSIGCDEYHAGAVTGPLTVGITASFTRVVAGYPVAFTALIEGPTDLSAWDFGDGTLKMDEPYAAHSWSAPGDYVVSLWAFSDSYPGGISTNVIIHVVDGLHYVAANSTNPVAPYASWATAARNIQDAINAAEPGATVMVVSNGSYGPINIPAFMTVRSVNGPQLTTINGGGSSRCASLAPSATLSGFTLANGLGQYDGGGGAYGGTLNNCALTGNRANGRYQCSQCYDPQCRCWRDCYPCDYVAGGGGASSCTLNNCTLSGNSANGDGGGAYSCTLNNCTLASNSSTNYGGGAYGCTLNNCTLTGNSVNGNPAGVPGGGAGYGGGAYSCTLNNCTLTGNSALAGGGANSCTLNNCTLTGNRATYGGGAEGGSLNNCIVYCNTAPSGANYDYGTLNYCCTTPLPGGGTGNITNAPLFVDTNGWANLRLQSNSPCINAGNNSYATNATDLDGNPRISGGTVDIGAYEYQWPQLTIAPSGPNVLLTWPTNNAGYDYTGYTLQSTTNLVSPAVWRTNSPAPVVIGGQNTVTNPITGAQQFYRLVQ